MVPLPRPLAGGRPDWPDAGVGEREDNMYKAEESRGGTPDGRGAWTLGE